jgi:hypothetical protein
MGQTKNAGTHDRVVIRPALVHCPLPQAAASRVSPSRKECPKSTQQVKR